MNNVTAEIDNIRCITQIGPIEEACLVLDIYLNDT